MHPMLRRLDDLASARPVRTQPPGRAPDWLDGGAEMWWSQADASTYRHWLDQAGFTVDSEEFVPEGDRGHVLFWCRRR
jgi:hypothetical protein